MADDQQDAQLVAGMGGVPEDRKAKQRRYEANRPKRTRSNAALVESLEQKLQEKSLLCILKNGQFCSCKQLNDSCQMIGS